MFFRRTRPKVTTSAKPRTRLVLEQLEDRCVPSATDLGVADSFNGFIFKNYTASNSDVEGRLAVGHNATLQNYSVGASLSNSHGTRDDLVVENNLTYTYGQVFNGNIAYGNSASLTGVGVPNGFVHPGTPINFASAQTDLDAKSAVWATYGANGTVANNWGGLVLTGSDPNINVFDLTASQLQNIWGLTINAPAGSTVLVNVSGTSAAMQYFGMNINGTDGSHVLFNFSQATSLTMNGIGFQGSILAPNAMVNFNNGSVTGTLVASCFTGSGQLDCSSVNIDIPQFIPAVISGTVFQDWYGTGIPVSGEPGLTPVFVILQGVSVPAYYSTETDSNGNFTISVLEAGTYTMSIVDATGLGYVLVSLHVGTAGGTASLGSGEILNIPISSGTIGQGYNFGLNSAGSVGEH